MSDQRKRQRIKRPTSTTVPLPVSDDNPFPKRRAVLFAAGGKRVDKIEDANYVRIWLEDGTEVDVELFQRHGWSLLNVRSPTDMLMVVPDAANTIYIGRRP